MKILLQITVDQPAGTVFDQIADTRNEVKWNTQMSEVKLVGEEPIRKGSVFKEMNRGNEFTVTLSEYNRPNSLSFQVHGKPMDINANVTIKVDSATRTTVIAEYNIAPKGFIKILMFLMMPILQKQFLKEFENFKRFSESSKKI
jgi:hypothetical protein